jgi:L-lactate dehydrogenase
MRDLSNKVTIIGAGSVGATIAYTLVVGGIASDIVMIDIKGAKSLGEALDIRQGIPFCSPSKVRAGSYQDAKDSDIVILTSGVARMPGQSRLDLAQTNVNITKSIIPEIMKYAPDAIYIIVSNPVDILTYQFSKTTGFMDGRVFGSGTILDTARLRSRLSEYYNISQSNVHAYVFGEHGDSSFVPWSLANIANIDIDSYASSMSRCESKVPDLVHEEVEQYIRQSGGKIIERKGATFYAVAASVCHICRSIFGGADTPMTVSTLMHGEYGIEDVALSMLTVVGRTGIKGKLIAPLTPEEEAKLHHSAKSLKDAISQIQF